MSTLPWPQLRWGTVQPVDAVDAQMLPLRDAVRQRAREAAAEDDERQVD